MLVNKNKINLKELESGLDSLEHCLNKAHFLDYKKPITYEYNSRGFRDQEWPNDLSDVVWCIGDSFTSGIGQPFEETWPKVLENKIKKRCINLGLDGCSNDHIAHMAKEIFATQEEFCEAYNFKSDLVSDYIVAGKTPEEIRDYFWGKNN